MHYPWRPANHVMWLCQAPQLVDSPQTFPLADLLPGDWQSRLAHWVAHPETRPRELAEPPHPRLGYYFERLYECVLTQLLGWELVARNLQVREAGGRTLGELDFVVRDPESGVVEHHEIAVKFYLGYPQGGAGTRWYGPNSRDRLDLKARRLLDHQSRSGERPETRALLAELGVRGPVVPRVFMPGYLFYPAGQVVRLPAFVPRDHLRGHWLYHRQVAAMDTRHWVPLPKPHWLGPWWQSHEPDGTEASIALAEVEEHNRPRLFAALAQAPDTGLWREAARTFVVPPAWPGPAAGG